MFEGTQYTALISSLRQGDWDGVAQLIGAEIDRAEARAYHRAFNNLTPNRSFQQVDRTLDTDILFTADTIGVYTVQCSIPITALLASALADVRVRVDGKVQSGPGDDISATLSLGLALSPNHRKTVILLAKAGQIGRLESVAVSPGNLSLLYAFEATFS